MNIGVGLNIHTCEQDLTENRCGYWCGYRMCTVTEKSFRSEKLSEKNGFQYNWVLYPLFLEGILSDH